MSIHSKCSQFSSFLDISLQCSQSFPNFFQKWSTMSEISRIFWISHSGTFLAHQYGSFSILLAGNTVITLLGKPQKTLEWATQEHHSYILWENFEHSQDFPNGEIPVTWSGTLWTYWPFSVLGKLQENWLGKFWMNLGYAGWVLDWYFVHFLVMYLQCTGPGHHPLPPVWAATVVDKTFGLEQHSIKEGVFWVWLL